MILNTPQVLLCDKMSKDEKKWAFVTYEGEQIRIRGFVWEISRKELTWLT